MSASTSKSTSPVLVLASAPPLALALFGLLLGLGVPPVPEWFWPTPTTNMAEAAALGDAARVRSLAADGISLDTPLPVREDVRNSEAPPVMAPLEAAIRHRSEYVVELLLELGVRPPTEEARRLHCLATLMDAAPAAKLIQDTFDVPSPSCDVQPPDPAGAC